MLADAIDSVRNDPGVEVENAVLSDDRDANALGIEMPDPDAEPDAEPVMRDIRRSFRYDGLDGLLVGGLGRGCESKMTTWRPSVRFGSVMPGRLLGGTPTVRPVGDGERDSCARMWLSTSGIAITIRNII